MNFEKRARLPISAKPHWPLPSGSARPTRKAPADRSASLSASSCSRCPWWTGPIWATASSRKDLVGAGSVSPEVLLAPFTKEVQQSLGEKRFQDAAQAMRLSRPLPEGMALDQFYDTQLAALGNFLFNSRKFVAAASVWSVLVEHDKSSGTASRGLALSLLASGQMQKAAAEVRRSLALAPGWPDKVRFTGSNLQDVFPAVQDLTGIREELKAPLDKQPDNADLNLLMAFVDLFQGNLPGADRPPANPGRKGRGRPTACSIESRRGASPIPFASGTVGTRRAASDLTGLEEAPLSPEGSG